MRTKLLVVAAAILLCAGVVVWYLTRPATSKHAPKRAPASGDVHVKALQPRTAMLQAPEGKTPCESAYLAIMVEWDTAQSLGVGSMFAWVAPREQFLAGCEALPEASKPCMVPRYTSLHREECERLRPPPGALKGMFQVRTRFADPAEQAAANALLGLPDAGPGK